METKRPVVLLPTQDSPDYLWISQFIEEASKNSKNVLLIPLGLQTRDSLDRFNASIRYPEDFLDRRRGEQIDSQARKLAQSWYLPLEEEIVFDDVNLAQMCEYSFYYVFVDCLRSIDIAKKMLESERMDRLVLPGRVLTKEISEICYESLPNALEMRAQKLGVPIERARKALVAAEGNSHHQFSDGFTAPHLYERFLEISRGLGGRSSVFFFNVYARESIANEIERKHGLRSLRTIPYRKGSARTRKFEQILKTRTEEFMDRIISDQEDLSEASSAAIALASERIKEFLTSTVPILSEFVEWARYYSRRMKPRVFVLMEDATPINRCVARVLREDGAQVLIIQHGLLAYDMAGLYLMPFEGSVQAVWGRYYQEWHSSRGKDPSTLVVTGAPNFENIVPDMKEVSSVAEKLGLDIGRPTILIGTSRYAGIRSISTIERELRFFEGVYQGLSGENEYQIVTKMHPSCGKDYYNAASHFADHYEVKTILTRDHFRELLALSKVLVIPLSSIGYEAVLSRIPLVCVDFEEYGEENAFVSEGVSVGVRKASELMPGIKTAIDSTSTGEYEASRTRFIEYHLDGPHPTTNVAKLINELHQTHERIAGAK